MKLKEKLAEDAFWAAHPSGAMSLVREAWPKGYIEGFERCRELQARDLRKTAALMGIAGAEGCTESRLVSEVISLLAEDCLTLGEEIV